MSDSVYQVVGECAYVTTDTAVGRAKVLLYKGALVSAAAPELKHLLSTGLVAKVGGDETGGVNAEGQPAEPVTAQKADSPPVKSDEVKSDSEPNTADANAKAAADEVAAKREAARAKLPEGGAMPHHAAGQSVWVEWHVNQGGLYDDLKDQDKPALVELAKSRQS
jgi:hypothetical protein